MAWLWWLRRAVVGLSVEWRAVEWRAVVGKAVVGRAWAVVGWRGWRAWRGWRGWQGFCCFFWKGVVEGIL